MVSVIVLVFDQAEILKVLLQCLEAQTYPEAWEVLVTDDGSSGAKTWELVQAAAHRGKLNIRYVWQPHRGFRAAAARNNAIHLAQGRLLVFLDGDMLVGPTFLAEHVTRHNGERRIVCGSRRFCVANAGQDLADSYAQGKLIVLGSREWKRQNFFAGTAASWMALLSCNFSIWRNPCVLFDPNFEGWGVEDREFAFRIVVRHQYKVSISMEAGADHISSVDGDSWNPLRSRRPEHDAIARLVRNLLYFAELYPDADLSPTLDLLRRYHVDQTTGRWYFDAVNLEPDIDTAIISAREWMNQNSIIQRSSPSIRESIVR